MSDSDRGLAQEAVVKREDEEAIRQYVANFEAAWNRHDAEALFGKRAKEIDRINAFGGWIKDPVADERVMKHLFAGPMGQSIHKITAERIRFLTPTVALVVIHMFRTSTGPNAGNMSELGNRSLHILVKSGGIWELTGFANVPILSPPAQVREAEGPDVIYATTTP